MSKASAKATVIATRPTPGQPRPYEFPAFERSVLSNGLTVLVAPMAGRPLISASLILRNGAADDDQAVAGATALAARALSEGTERYDAVALVEATERLGAGLHADAGWDASTISVEVPVARLEPALDLLAELAAHPTFPAREVERLRGERLNDLLQARAEPRRRVDEAFIATIYEASSPYHQPAGGLAGTVETLDPERLAAAWQHGFDPARMTLILAGDLAGLPAGGPAAIAERLFGGWTKSPDAAAVGGPVSSDSAVDSIVIKVLDRPGSVQTEIRVGHVGVPRRFGQYAALSVMSAILGGLFNSRLNMKLREEKGYTYGASAGFDPRRGAGPFSARVAVNTEVTVPALVDLLAELDRIRQAPVSAAELAAARDFLVGVFPLRFETPGPVVGALGGIVVHDLPDDELTTYRARIEAVSAADVQAVAEGRIHPDQAAIVMVGDAQRIVADLEAAAIGPVEVIRDEPPAEETSEG
ncbi:MAG TPA: pitrilysin family protein [Candidatus Limnocylindrales bacterium]|nr:pitrilysin family protein [Candidatus Limnocylindrales bacterium]